MVVFFTTPDGELMSTHVAPIYNKGPKGKKYATLNEQIDFVKKTIIKRSN